MSPRGERLWAKSLWTGSLLLELGAVALILEVLLVRRPPLALPEEGVRSPAPEDAKSNPRRESLEALAKKRMTKAIAKPPAPIPAPPPKPPLASLVRLSGLVDYRPNAPCEAIIEFLPAAKSKSYRPGDFVWDSGALVTRIGEAVFLEYDGRKWVLTFRGVEEVPEASGGAQGSSSEVPER